MYLVYLAGPISGLSYDESCNWRQQVIDRLPDGIGGLSPMRAKSYLSTESSIGDQYPDWPLSTQRGIYARDIFDCHRADVVLVNLLGAEKVSIGTVMEIAWAANNNVPVVLVMEKEGNIHDHAMIREACPFRTDDLNEAIDLVSAILLPQSHHSQKSELNTPPATSLKWL